MALDFTLVLRAETAAAKAELEAAARGIQGVSTATEKATTASRASATAAQAEAAARQRATQANRAYTSSAGMAAGATGNLAAQFNDIGMMLAAGQNPLQLAIQQGTQITQVIGPMGAAGAAKALGAAFMGMLSPINLITLGVIAASGYMIQWLTAADDDAAAVTAEFERQKAAIEGIVAETEKLRLQRGMMSSGAQSQDEQVVLEEITRLTEQRAAAQERLNSLTEMGGRAAGFAGQAAAARDALAAEIAGLDAKIEALNAQREINAAAERNAELSERIRASSGGIASALQSADGSQLEAAFRVAFPAASALLSMAQSIVSTIGGAPALLAAQSGQNYLEALGNQSSGPDAARTRVQFGGAIKISPTGAGLPAARIPGRGGGGGAAAARDEADALQELIASLEGEVAALRVTDPVQQEMLQHREALAGATDAERQKVEELIAAREREAAAMEAAQERAEFFGSLGESAIDALIVKGESFNEVLKQIASSLIQAAIQAAIFGEGPFGSIFGGTSIMAGIIPGLATGGMVRGPGTSTSDSIPAMLSNGEYVVNAKATARHRHLLEAINNGGRARFAEGGPVGGAGGGIIGRSGRQMPATVLIDLRGVQGDRAIEEKVRRGAAEVVGLYDREGLAPSVQRVSRDPRRRG